MRTVYSFIITSLLGILLCLSLFCCNKLFPDEKLTLQREDYFGNELRTDGYYYTFGENDKIRAVSFFYRNGIIIVRTGSLPADLDYVEKIIVDSDIKSKDHWGVFVIKRSSIQFEKWVGTTGISAGLSKNMGNIINDTTIHFTERYNSEYDKTSAIKETWHFKQFDNKPDSTNNYIK